MPSVTVNEKTIIVDDGSTVLKAAERAGVDIPTLCYLDCKPPLGSCRVCIVEVEGAKSLMAACSTPVYEGMKVFTNTKKVREQEGQ